jgi:hypothetical protein
MYYKRFTCDYDPNNRWCPTPSNAKPFPPGLRMLAGDPERRTQNNSDQTNQAILFESGSSGEVYGFPKTLGNYLQMNIRFPSCWDGVNVDSPDHKSHVRFTCPYFLLIFSNMPLTNQTDGIPRPGQGRHDGRHVPEISPGSTLPYRCRIRL